jgi:hypothetical protein
MSLPSRSVRKTAALLFLAISACYFALSAGSLEGVGYSSEERISGMQMLAVFNAWVKGRPVPAMIWSRHGPVPLLLDLPFIKLGKLYATPDFMLSLAPLLLTAGISTILFLWLRKLCSPGISLLLTLTGAFGTMLWPYAYIGLETKQSFLVLLSGYLGLANGKIRGWPRLLLLAVICGFAITAKSTGFVLLPAIAALIYAQFRDDWRVRKVQAITVIVIIAGFLAAGAWGRSFYWTPMGGIFTSHSGWYIESPLQLFTNAIGVFGSSTKGLFIYAPILLLSLYAIPRVIHSHRQTAIFALLVTGCTVALITPLIVQADEVWGPRYMHVAVAPLLLCIGAAWPRFRWQSVTPMVVLAAVGLVISFLGAFFYYGMRRMAIGNANQNTMEWIVGDSVWNEVTFNARLFSVWRKGGTAPVPWTPYHVWVWEAPPDTPDWKGIDLRTYSQPQSFMLHHWNKTLNKVDLVIFRICVISLVAGPLLLFLVVFRTVKESRETKAPREIAVVAHQTPGR